MTLRAGNDSLAGSGRAFTLLELMVVVSIIGILVTMLVGVLLGIGEKNRTKAAKMEAYGLVMAVRSFKSEMGYWPNQTQGENDSTYLQNNGLVILALTSTNNARHKLFYTVRTNSLDENGNLLDPWGFPYVICMDENNDNTLARAAIGGVAYTSPALYGSVARVLCSGTAINGGKVADVWSFGNSSNSLSINSDP